MKSGTFLEVPGPLWGCPAGGAASLGAEASDEVMLLCRARLAGLLVRPSGSKPLQRLRHHRCLGIKARDQRLTYSSELITDVAATERKTGKKNIPSGKTKADL